MRTRYFLSYEDDTLNGLYSHRGSELINRPAMTLKLVSKKQQQQNGKVAASVRLGKGLLKKLRSMGIH
jgi:hypothetical protein